MRKDSKLEYCEHCEEDDLVFVGEIIKRCISCMRDIEPQGDDFEEKS